jgi:hypothetical protein
LLRNLASFCPLAGFCRISSPGGST